ncbi:MAG: TonB-dependent receptor [Krumholzibacteria bacterium]|nr:TonB-dependent receptor [Candidatus Krumholzibacteria bacterium]
MDYTDLSLADLMQTDVVYGASKFEQEAKDAPSSITIVTAREIKGFGYRTLAEVLASVRGFYTTYDRNYEYLGVRGFGRPGDYNSRVLVLIDGIRLNENVYDATTPDTAFPLDLDLIQRIEIIRGPSSSLYGTSAVFAIVNIITKSAHEYEGIQVTGHAGSFGALGGQIAAGSYAEDGISVLVSASAGRVRGQDHYFAEFDDPLTNNGVAEDCDEATWQRLFGRVDRGPLHLEALLSTGRKHVPTAPWGTIFNDSRTRTEDDNRSIAAWYDGEVASRTRLLTRVAYGSYDYDGAWVYDYADEGDPPAPVVMRDNGIGRWLDSELQLTRQVGGGHMVAVGGEFRRSFQQDQAVWDEDPYWSYTDDRQDSYNGAVYLLGDVEISRRVRLNLGVRWDEYSTFGSSTNPRLALVAEPVDGTVTKFIYGSAFRAPNVFELYYGDGGTTQKANPDLQPETIKTAELVLDQALGAAASGSLSLFRYANRDLIEQVEDPADGLLVFRNESAVEVLGAELEVRYRSGSTLTATASYAYQDARYEDGDLDLTNSPRQTAKLNLLRQVLPAPTTLGLEFLFFSARETPRGGHTAGFLLTNLNLVHAPLNAPYELSIGVRNLFDSEHWHPGGPELVQNGLRQDGRSFRLKVVIRP